MNKNEARTLGSTRKNGSRPQSLNSKRTRTDFVCDLPALIDGCPISGRAVPSPCGKGFAMFLRRDLVMIAISTLVGVTLAYVVHGRF
jgi:hypothetical protein